MRTSFLLRLALGCAVLATACASDDAASGARGGTEGRADFSLTSADGSRESLTVSGPPGELEARFVETTNACTLQLRASEPRQGDKTSAARARRVVLDLQLPAKPGLLSGDGDVIEVAQPSPLAGDAMVRVERGESAWWYSRVGGQVEVARFEPRVGAEIAFEVRGVPLDVGGGGERKRVVDGRATAKLRELLVIGGRGGCPEGTPGRGR